MLFNEKIAFTFERSDGNPPTFFNSEFLSGGNVEFPPAVLFGRVELVPAIISTFGARALELMLPSSLDDSLTSSFVTGFFSS